jgi:hypothetical protein
MKGCNSPDIQELSLSYDFHKKFDDNIDVTVILGENDSCHQSLLLLRIWKSPKSPKGFSEKNLLERISKKLSRGGLTCRRNGGSSGLVHDMDSKTFFKLLNFPGAFPRKAYGVKFVKHKLYWRCHYISPYRQKKDSAVPKKLNIPHHIREGYSKWTFH